MKSSPAMKALDTLSCIRLFLLLPVIMTTSMVNSQEPMCQGGDDIFNPDQTKCYRFVEYASKWWEAKDACTLVGGFLAEPESSQELQLIVKQWKLAGTNANGDKNNFWLGGRCATKTSGNPLDQCTGGWFWNVAGSMNLPWATGKPSHQEADASKGVEACTIYSQRPSEGLWYRSCIDTQPAFVCQKEVTVDQSQPQSTTSESTENTDTTASTDSSDIILIVVAFVSSFLLTSCLLYAGVVFKRKYDKYRGKTTDQTATNDPTTSNGVGSGIGKASKAGASSSGGKSSSEGTYSSSRKESSEGTSSSIGKESSVGSSTDS